MRKAIRIIIPLLLVLAIILCTGWYLFRYDKEFTRDALLYAARYFERAGNRTASAWFYTNAYKQADNNDAVAIELANQYKSSGNYTKAEYTLSNAIADGGGVDLYIALCKTYVEQNKVLDAMRLLSNVANKDIKAQLDEMRPTMPTCSPDPINTGAYFTQYITVNIAAEKGTLYVNTKGQFPSVPEDLYTGGITLVDGENTIYAVAVDENGLVSPAAIFGFTVGGVIKKVDFADPAMEAAFREALNFSKDTEIYTDDLWTIKEFTVPEGTKSLTDLKNLVFVEKLTIAHGDAGQLSSISGLGNLQELTIRNVSVSAEEIPLLGQLPALRKLTLDGCNLSTVSGLESAKGLTYLDLQNNALRNLSPLSVLANLQELNLSHNALNDLATLITLKNLTVLNVAHNNLTSLAPVASMSAIKQLNVSNNSLTELTGVQHLAALEQLDISYNTISDVSVLSSSTSLTRLNLSNNTISDISMLSALNKLVNLDFSYNKVTVIPQWEADCALVNIDGSHNQIKSLEPLKGLKHLNNVFMDYNAGISSVSALANCPKLIQVNVYGTKVTQVGALTSQSIIVNYNPTQ